MGRCLKCVNPTCNNDIPKHLRAGCDCKFCQQSGNETETAHALRLQNFGSQQFESESKACQANRCRQTSKKKAAKEQRLQERIASMSVEERAEYDAKKAEAQSNKNAKKKRERDERRNESN